MVDTRSEAPLARLCSRQGCKREALYTLTYVYADSTAVVGPLSMHNEPHAYDLCELHAQRMTAPRGWEVLRLEIPGPDLDTRAADHASVTPLSPFQNSVDTAPGQDPDNPAQDSWGAQPTSTPMPTSTLTSSPAPIRPDASVESESRPPEPVQPGQDTDLQQVSDENEDSLVDEIFFRHDSQREMIRDSTPGQPRGMRMPHLRRRPRRDP